MYGLRRDGSLIGTVVNVVVLLSLRVPLNLVLD